MWRREYGFAWEKPYPHFLPQYGTKVVYQDPRLNKYFPSDGFVFGTHLMSIRPAEAFAAACCSCFTQAENYCLNCGLCYCQWCCFAADHKCDRNTIRVSDWEIFAALYPFACQELFSENKSAQQLKYHFDQVLDFIETMLLEQPNEHDSDQVYSIQTSGTEEVLETLISGDWLDQIFSNVSQGKALACRLVYNHNKASSKYGHIGMLVRHVGNREWSFCLIAKEPKQLMDQLHHAYCEQVYFPEWIRGKYQQ